MNDLFRGYQFENPGALLRHPDPADQFLHLPSLEQVRRRSLELKSQGSSTFSGTPSVHLRPKMDIFQATEGEAASSGSSSVRRSSLLSQRSSTFSVTPSQRRSSLQSQGSSASSGRGGIRRSPSVVLQGVSPQTSLGGQGGGAQLVVRSSRTPYFLVKQ